MKPALSNRTSMPFAQPPCVVRPCAHGHGAHECDAQRVDFDGVDSNSRIRQR